MSKSATRRVNYDDIEFDDQLTLYDGTSYTDIIYGNYPNGMPEIEFNYIDDLPSGIQRQWYPDGQLQDEWEAIRGQGSAWSREWHPNDFMKSERVNEDLFPARIREWSEDGRLLRAKKFDR